MTHLPLDIILNSHCCGGRHWMVFELELSYKIFWQLDAVSQNLVIETPHSPKLGIAIADEMDWYLRIEL